MLEEKHLLIRYDDKINFKFKKELWTLLEWGLKFTILDDRLLVVGEIYGKIYDSCHICDREIQHTFTDDRTDERLRQFYLVDNKK